MLDYWRTEVAFGTAPDSTTPAWQDVTTYVDAQQGVSISRGRTNQFENVTPGQASNTFNNKDGRFTAENTSSPYYPNVVLATRIRHSWRYTTGGNPTVAGNFLSANQASFETSVADWTAIGSVAPGKAQSNTHVQDGSQAMLLTWGTGGTQTGGAQTTVSNLVIGRQYTFSVYVYVPSGGSPAVIGFVSGLNFTSASAVTNAYTRLSCTFTPTTASGTSIAVGILNNAASTAGQQVWVDAVMIDEGSNLATFTTAAPPIRYLFDGCVDSWPVQWTPGAFYAEAPISASDRLKRLGLSRNLPDIIGCEVLADSPAAYYNLGEPEGALSVGNTAPTTQPQLTVTQLGSGGTLTFGNATGAGTDGLTAAQFTPASITNGLYLKGDKGAEFAGGFALSLECWFNTSTIPGTTTDLIAGFDGFGTRVALQVGSGSGYLVGGVLDRNNNGILVASSGTPVTDGLTHHAVLTFAQNVGTPGTMDMLVYLDGAIYYSGVASYLQPFIIGVTSLRVGGGPGVASTYGGPAVYTGTIAHAAIYDSTLSAARITQHYLAGTTGFAGERSDQRTTRIAGYAGIAAADMSVTENGSSLVAAQDTTGQKALDAIGLVSTTESAPVFFNGAGALIVQGRSHRYNPTSKITLAAGDYEVGLTPTMDDFGVENDVTMSKQAGPTVRAVNAASLAQIGYYTNSVDIIPYLDSEVTDAANWRVNTVGTPLSRFPQVTVNLYNKSTATVLAVLALEIGDQITLSGLPTTGPATSVDLFIEGLEMDFGADRLSVTFNCSRLASTTVWQLDSSTYSVLGTTTRLAY